MKTVPRILILILAVAGWAAAKPPVKPPVTAYASLWNNSPFTSKPPPPEQVAAVNLLDDYALLGVSPIAGGYRVTLINKKKPEDRITVDSDKPSKDFKIVNVTRKIGDPLGTVVNMMAGTIAGTVSFDEKLLAVATQPNARPPGQTGQPNQPGQPPNPAMLNGQPPQPQILNNGAARQPRPRVVPPPSPGAGGAPQASTPNIPQRQDRRGGR